MSHDQFNNSVAEALINAVFFLNEKSDKLKNDLWALD